MSYTKRERKKIASQILEYAKESEYDSCTSYDNQRGKWFITRHPMTAYHRDVLDLVARDVQGLIIRFE